MPQRRVVLHAGFHKTGTTTVQTFLRANRKHIYPSCALVLPKRLRGGAARYAVRYARFRTAALLDEFGAALHDVLSALDVKHRHVLIADENLAGLMPGREGQEDYGATPALMARAEHVIRDVFGDDPEVLFHFTTRDPDDWLASTYKHVLRTSRLTMDWDSYVTAYSPAKDLTSVIHAVAGAVNGTVSSSDLADLTGQDGPAAPLLDLIDLPSNRRARLARQSAANIGPDDAQITGLLSLNRSNLSDEALKAAKTDFLNKDTDHDR